MRNKPDAPSGNLSFKVIMPRISPLAAEGLLMDKGVLGGTAPDIIFHPAME